MSDKLNIAILGGGESGVGAALLAVKLGFDVYISDIAKLKDAYKEICKTKGIDIEEGYHNEERLFAADLIIKSPGIPDGVPLIQSLRSAGKSVIDEIEFAYRYAGDAKIIAITGTNGKTTTTQIAYHLLAAAGFDVAVGGNIGFSFAKIISERDFAYYVLEVSSFQLDGTVNFKPTAAILTNITPDHLDRYKYKMENYVASKFQIVKNQDASDHFIYNSANEPIHNWMLQNGASCKAALHPLSNDQFETETELVIGPVRISKSSIQLQGKHNYHNIACAVTAALAVGVSAESIVASIATFKADAHRMEKAGMVDGVEYINDSKATNVDAVWYALDAMTSPVIWMVGGTDKGNDYSSLMPLVSSRVKGIVCLGADNAKLHDAFGHLDIPMADADSAAYAVKLAHDMAAEGDVVLLSPACASFDLFKNYMDRGDQFKAAVQQLKLNS